MLDNSLQPVLPLAAAPGGPAPVREVGASSEAAVPQIRPGQDKVGLAARSRQLTADFGKLDAAIKAARWPAARRLRDELNRKVEAGIRQAQGTPYLAGFTRAHAALAAVSLQLDAAPASEQHSALAPVKQRVAVPVGLRAVRLVDAESAPPAGHLGPLGGVGQAADALGNALAIAGHIVFFPLELAGKLITPLRDTSAQHLGEWRTAIDHSAGRLPVIGSAVRFATGFSNSLVGLVDGALQGVTHPVQLIKGLGSLAWTLAALLPPTLVVRLGWDAAVNGKPPGQSYGDSLHEGRAVFEAFFGNALQCIAQKNYAGAMGQLTGDIGTFFVGGAGMVGGSARGAKAVESVTAAGRVLGTGRDVIGLGLTASGRIFQLGLQGNWALWNGVRRITNQLPGLRGVSAVSEEVVEGVRARYLARKLARGSGTDTAIATPASSAERTAVQAPAWAEVSYAAQPLKIKVFSPTQARVVEGTLVGRAADGTYTVMGDRGPQAVMPSEILKLNPGVGAGDLWAIGGKIENRFILRGLPGTEGIHRGRPANIPVADGTGLWPGGRVFGRKENGDIVAQRPLLKDANGHVVQAAGALVVPLDAFLEANPTVLRGRKIGSFEGTTLSVGEYQPTSHTFGLLAKSADGVTREVGRLTSQQLAEKLGGSLALEHLPLAKVGVDGRAHLASDAAMGLDGIGAGGPGSAIGWWYAHDQALQAKALKAIAADPAIVGALKHWGALSLQEQVQTAQAIAKAQGAAYGFQPVKLEVVPSFPGHPFQMGVFEPKKCLVKVRADQLRDPANFLRTFFHEQLHAYQWQVTQRFRNHQLAPTDPLYSIGQAWSENWAAYSAPKDGVLDYLNQPLEAHAFQGGDSFSAFVQQTVKHTLGVRERVRLATGH